MQAKGACEQCGVEDWGKVTERPMVGSVAGVDFSTPDTESPTGGYAVDVYACRGCNLVRFFLATDPV